MGQMKIQAKHVSFPLKVLYEFSFPNSSEKYREEEKIEMD